MDQVMSAIDGRRTVRAHGDHKMPVWGEIFRKRSRRWSTLQTYNDSRRLTCRGVIAADLKRSLPIEATEHLLLGSARATNEATI